MGVVRDFSQSSIASIREIIRENVDEEDQWAIVDWFDDMFTKDVYINDYIDNVAEYQAIMVDKHDISSKKFDEIRSFDGRSKKEGWKPLKVKRVALSAGHELGDGPDFMQSMSLMLPIVSIMEKHPIEHFGMENGLWHLQSMRFSKRK